MGYEILNENGDVVNTIVATLDFMEANYPGSYREIVQNANTVPTSITNGQARAALILNGMIDQIQPIIDAIPDDTQRRLANNDWEYRLVFERDNPTLLALADSLGLTESQIDDLFIQASGL